VDLEVQHATLAGERATAQERLASVELALLGDRPAAETERERLHGERLELREALASLDRRLELVDQKRKLLAVESPIAGEVVTWDVERLLQNRPVQRGEALLAVVDPTAAWELELRMPEGAMGHIRRAQREHGAELEVEYFLATDPGRKRYGTIREVHRHARVRGDEGNTVLVKVSLDEAELAAGSGNVEQGADPRPGAEASGRVRCGRRSLGYVWLHDVAAFIQSKVLFRL
jgi:hypothetical protein